jgi:hypothetical protein
VTGLLRRLLGDPTTCRCGHPLDVHRHWRRGDDCGVCGPTRCAGFRRFRRPPAHQGVDLHAVCRDDRLVEDIRAGDLNHAYTIAPPELVDAHANWADVGVQQ